MIKIIPINLIRKVCLDSFNILLPRIRIISGWIAKRGTVNTNSCLDKIQRSNKKP